MKWIVQAAMQEKLIWGNVVNTTSGKKVDTVKIFNTFWALLKLVRYYKLHVYHGSWWDMAYSYFYEHCNYYIPLSKTVS